MEPLKDYHHYKKELIDSKDRVAKCERYVIDILINSEIPDSKRDSSIAFELKHHHSTAQFARILARKRNLPIDICTIGALLHDIYVIKNDKYKEHAHLGADMLEEILNEIGVFTDEEKKQIYKIVYNHSDKNIWSDDSFAEFGKDADVLDCFLYPNGFGYYLKNKPLNIFCQYIVRAKKLWKELNIPEEKAFKVLDNYHQNWLEFSFEVDEEGLIEMLNNKNMPTFCFTLVENKYKIYINKQNLDNIIETNIVKENYDELLEKSKNNIILVWTAINSYEILQINDSKERIEELGIKI